MLRMKFMMLPVTSSETSLRAEDEVHDASSYQLLRATAQFKHGT